MGRSARCSVNALSRRFRVTLRGGDVSVASAPQSMLRMTAVRISVIDFITDDSRV
jgi:hypothetical protein